MTIPPRRLPPEGADATAWVLAIHRFVPVPQWREALDDVPAEHRSEVERHLRDLATRMRVVRRMRAEAQAKRGARR